MLSPPVGWGARAPRTPDTPDTFPTSEEIVAGGVYGMGAYPADDSGAGAKLMVFELRNLADNLDRYGDPPARDWWDSAWRVLRWELQLAVRDAIPHPSERPPQPAPSAQGPAGKKL
jgi:hypothetical protein